MKSQPKQLQSFEYLSKLRSIDRLAERLQEPRGILNIKTLAGSLKSLAIASLSKKITNPILIICPSAEEAEDWLHDLKLLADSSRIAMLVPPKRYLRFADESPSEDISWLIEGLATIIQSNNAISVATAQIFSLSVPTSSQLSVSRLRLTKNQTLDYNEFIKNLSLSGFDRKDYVASQGDFAVRGGIVDVYPAGWDNPLRIEFWGDDIESLRQFEVISQRSIHEHDQVEFIARFFHAPSGGDTATEESQSLFHYLAPNQIIVQDSPEKIEKAIADCGDDRLESIYKGIYEYSVVNINGLGAADIEVASERQPGFSGSIKKLAESLRSLVGQGTKILLCAEGKIHQQRFRELVENSASLTDGIDSISGEKMGVGEFSSPAFLKAISWESEALSNGFIMPRDGVACFTEHEVFERLRIHDSRSRKIASGISAAELKELSVGDFVVHVDKGIGRFDGFEAVSLGGTMQDCVRLIYADGDILYVSLNYINKIQKFSAEEGVLPKLSKLGSSEWLRKKARTKKKLKDIARDLILLYARRKSQPGFEYPTDTIWQKEFEASFMYEDTPDQARTTDEVKADMESASSMDRLVCGDVGFGKTEIAIRAAFKAVQAGKQVAVLVPTTILAEQHYMTFKDRLHKYPVLIRSLSRFRSKSEQMEILEKLKSGGVDILIGTHRILSKDVEFKELGLLIIDEEHRFGVAAKEKLRQLRATIDTLTLTATPIPRTLNFSLMGARDLSIIETPPRNRLPVYTEISQWNSADLMKALSREIERGGQVFFVNDNIRDIDKLAVDLKMILPTIKLGVAHGQMPSAQLESAMEKFMQRKYDVLLSTKIVESGLDIPNANTMLINKPQNFGLAELYQLRGRVGRSNTQAYCYLLIPPVKTLTHKALQRLQAIEEFTDLGSGFQLAMRDLEIRGAGNLLGAEQSGFINEIGFELYQKVLEEAVFELKTEEFSDLFKNLPALSSPILRNDDLQIELDTDAYLPSSYVKTDTERFSIYKKLYQARNYAELQSIADELADRFGKIPKQAQGLIFAVKLRITALNTGFVKVIVKPPQMKIEFPPDSNEEYYSSYFPEIVDYIQQIDGTQLVQANGKLYLEMTIESRDQAVETIWKIKKHIEAQESA